MGASRCCRPPTAGGAPTNVTLGMLIRIAFQLQDNQIVGGPKWLFEDRFDVLGSGNAPGAAPSMLFPKLQTLLADRFKLVTHTETRELPMFALVRTGQDKLGPNLKPSTATDCPVAPPPGAGNPAADSAADVAGSDAGLRHHARPRPDLERARHDRSDRQQPLAHCRLDGRRQDRAPGFLRVHARIRTGPIPGRTQRFAGRPPGPERPANDGPSLFAALPEQLGLKLESTKGPVSVLVIDRAEQPEAN